MLKVLEEVLKIEKLTDGMVVESSGVCEAGKGKESTFDQNCIWSGKN